MENHIESMEIWQADKVMGIRPRTFRHVVAQEIFDGKFAPHTWVRPPFTIEFRGRLMAYQKTTVRNPANLFPPMPRMERMRDKDAAIAVTAGSLAEKARGATALQRRVADL
ncbi:MAG: hypothetical protein ABW047_00805 [Nitrospiraceae bacterium]